MVEFFCIGKPLQGMGVHPAVQAGVLQGDQPDRLEPVCPGGLDMEAPLDGLRQYGENAELVTAGVDAQPVPEVVGDGCMLGKVCAKLFQVPDIVDSFLELSDETGCQGGDSDLPSLQLQGDEQVAFGIGRGIGFVDGDLEINRLG